jgi:hypothetical protein
MVWHYLRLKKKRSKFALLSFLKNEDVKLTAEKEIAGATGDTKSSSTKTGSGKSRQFN